MNHEPMFVVRSSEGFFVHTGENYWDGIWKWGNASIFTLVEAQRVISANEGEMVRVN